MPKFPVVPLAQLDVITGCGGGGLIVIVIVVMVAHCPGLGVKV